MTDPITRMFDEAFAPGRATPARPKVYVLVIEQRSGSDVTLVEIGGTSRKICSSADAGLSCGISCLTSACR